MSPKTGHPRDLPTPRLEDIESMVAVHHQGDQTHAVAAKRSQRGDAAGEFSISAARSFGLADAGALGRFIDDANPDVLLRLLPSSQTIVRTVPVPQDTDDRAALREALGLLAEAELPASLPAHRRAAGLIAPGRGGGASAGLLVGWPEAPTAGRPASSAPVARCPLPEAWVPEPVALAALAKAAGGCDTAVFADRSQGTIAVIAAGNRVLPRVLRLDGSDSDAWSAGVAAAIAETRRAAGLLPDAPVTDATPAPAHPLSLDPTRTPVRLGGAPRELAWIQQFGLAAGALAALTDPDPAVRSLASLHARAPREVQPAAARLLAWLSAPRHAAAVVALCVAAVLFLPLGTAYARHRLLEKRAGGLTELQGRLDNASRRVAFYGMLRDRRWPMTKLMADLAGAAPVGVELATLELDSGGGAAGGTVTVRGTADSADLVTTFSENLAKTRVFSDLATPTTGSSAEGVQFQLQAKVSSALYPAKPIEDFAARTLAQRLYGDDAVTPVRDAGDGDDEGEEEDESGPPGRHPAPRAGRERGEDRDHGATRPGRSSRPVARPSQAAGPVIPPPITDTEIAALDGSKAMAEWSKRRAASRQSGIDEATKSRLSDEEQKLFKRMKEAQKSAGGAASSAPPAASPPPAPAEGSAK